VDAQMVLGATHTLKLNSSPAATVSIALVLLSPSHSLP
jgi:hypothetical protein